MTMMIGRAPFSPEPAGVLNFTREGPQAVLYWQDFPIRFRVELAGEMIADSRRAKALHETGQKMRLFVPQDDVRMDLLTGAGAGAGSPVTGPADLWSGVPTGGAATVVATSFPHPPSSAPPIQDHFTFDLGAVDAWYLEDDQGYSHPRDPYHAYEIHSSSRQVVVRVGETVVARSDRPAILFETSLAPRFYLPPVDVQAGYLTKSETVSTCPYKGDGQHWTLTVGAHTIEDAAWSLPDPLGEANQIADWICFYPDKVTVEVDGRPIAA